MPCGTRWSLPLRCRKVARSLIPKNYCVEDCNYLLDYYRLTGDNRLLYGGGVVPRRARSGRRGAADYAETAENLPAAAGVKIDYRWTGHTLLTCRGCLVRASR